MRHTPLGALQVPAQGLGRMSMSEYYGRPDWDRALSAVHRALDLGVALLDTADIPDMAELGVGLVPYAPLGRGFLTGKVVPGSLRENDSRRAHPRFQGDHAATNRRPAETVGTPAAQMGVTGALLALAWAYARSRQLEISAAPIPGTSSPEHVAENVAALTTPLDDTVPARLDPLTREVSGERRGALQTVRSRAEL